MQGSDFEITKLVSLVFDFVLGLFYQNAIANPLFLFGSP